MYGLNCFITLDSQRQCNCYLQFQYDNKRAVMVLGSLITKKRLIYMHVFLLGKCVINANDLYPYKRI